MADPNHSGTTLATKGAKTFSEPDLEEQPEDDIDIEVEVKTAVMDVIQKKDYTRGEGLTNVLVKAIDKAPELASSALRELSYVKLPANKIKYDDNNSSKSKFTELENFHPCILDPESKKWAPMKDSFTDALSFARTRYWLNFALFLTYFAVFASMIDGHVDHGTGDITTIVLGAFFIFQEFRLLINRPVPYLKCTYNYTDIATIGFPFVTAILDRYAPGINIYYPPNDWLPSFSLLLLWISLISRLRVVKRIGILVIVIYSILQHIWPFIFIASAFLLAFAHALLVLLRHVPLINQASPYSGNLTNTAGVVADTISLTANSSDASNGAFHQWDTAVPSIIYFLGGDWSSLSAYDTSPYRTVLKCVFTFMVTIGILNVSIALLNDIFSKTYANGEREWVIMMAETVARVEMMMPKSILPIGSMEKKKNQTKCRDFRFTYSKSTLTQILDNNSFYIIYCGSRHLINESELPQSTNKRLSFT
ncbi:hypothetical protein BC936DRAFT_145671 [Jimgerdemannia flammicorona]|uniref:Ion transport domain-containing protein n=1 Tax=Jimgerdemannia flammicorona TaxID=994334 RepID=A0A433D9C8_9FUNG|nr:hypothetical protein BC936DRAFT_145671 [Jimgerdemannia flammicorona]